LAREGTTKKEMPLIGRSKKISERERWQNGKSEKGRKKRNGLNTRSRRQSGKLKRENGIG
jgi:hypothetical protein